MKRKFKIICRRTNTLEGYLFYDTDTRVFTMKIVPAPLDKVDCFFEILQRRGIFKVPQHMVDSWVDSRLIPPNRHGIEDVLKVVGLLEYDRFELLKYNAAECQMDTTYIQEIGL